jgi:hypothetical protein
MAIRSDYRFPMPFDDVFPKGAYALYVYDDALQALLQAEQKSPTIVRHNTMMREVVRSMYRRAPASAGRKSSALLALAERCGAVR